MDDIIDHVSELEQCLPEEKQKSDFYCFELNIVPSDDPRWIDITRQYYEGFRKSDDIALQMLTTAPTTLFSTIQNQEDAPPCSTCGSIMIRSGACYKCSNCGATSGCS